MRVALAEDQALLRAGLARLFEDAGHVVIGVAEDADGLRQLVARHPPDLAVVDIRMPPTYSDEGLQAARWMRETHPGVAVLLLSQHIEPTGLVELVAQGGFGYLLKDRVLEVDDFMDAAERVASGGSALDPQVVAALLVGESRGTALGSLTARESEVLALMAEGLNNAGIAQRLVLTERTVESHTRNVFMKLGLQADGDGHRRVLAVLAYLEGSTGTASTTR